MDRYFDRVLKLIDHIYAAALDDECWPRVLEELTTLLHGEGSTLFFTDNALKPIDGFFGHNVSPESISDYQEHYHKLDIRMHRSFPGYVGKIVTDGDLVDETVVKQHAFYQEFLRPIGHRYIISAILDLGDGALAFSSCHLGLSQEHAGQETLDKAGLLLPHLQRGLQLRRRWIAGNAREHAALEAFDRLGYGVFLLDERGRVAWQNVMASELLAARDGLITIDGELSTTNTKTKKGLVELIASVIDVKEEPRSKPGGLLTISRPSSRRAYQLLATPLPRLPSIEMAQEGLGNLPVVAVFVADPERHKVPKADALAKLYRLTKTEAKLAAAIASGISTKTYAEQEGRSVHYVRWLLKQLEAKTDTRRITDLIRLITSQIGFPEKVPDESVDDKEKEK